MKQTFLFWVGTVHGLISFKRSSIYYMYNVVATEFGEPSNLSHVSQILVTQTIRSNIKKSIKCVSNKLLKAIYFYEFKKKWEKNICTKTINLISRSSYWLILVKSDVLFQWCRTYFLFFAFLHLNSFKFIRSSFSHSHSYFI